MPNGNRRRPDTLELEVLRAPAAKTAQPQLQPQPLPQPQPQPRRSTSATLTSNKNPNDSVEDDRQPSTRPQTALTQTPKQSHWLKIAGLLSRNPKRNANATITNITANTDAATSATLAKPEPSTIDNSTATIPTLSPQIADSLPDVAAVMPRQHSSSKRRSRKSHSDSLYSLATLAQTGEVQLHSRDNSCTQFKEKDAEAEAGAAASALMYECTKAKDKTLLTSVPLRSVDNADEIADAVPPESKSGLRANLMSFLSKFAIWKTNSCRQQRKRASLRSKHTTPSGYSAAEAGDSLAGRKSVNISCDFEQFPGENSEEKLSRLANVKEVGMRRLSQMRRRRSSYYFSDNERRIRANDREFNGQFKYADNYIKTSKYSLMTFLPFNLLEQFQRLANFYFLCLLVLQLIPAISSLTPVTTAIPLIGVLTLTAVKDAYDDIQRHISDSQVNNRKSKALRNGKLVDEKWSGVQVGDVIRMENNQFVAADLLLLSTSEPNGLCFIETAELDGETNLKCKQCLTETIELGQLHDKLWNFNAEIICEKPNNLLNKFEGTLMWRNQRFPLDNEKILLRGCVLRNTQWCYGVVVFAGKDTKLMQNSGKTQFKSTGVDRLLNFIIIGIVLFLLSICAFFTLACAIWEGIIGQHFQAFLPWENIIPKSYAQGATVIGLLVFFSYAIVLNTVVPISLYVSVEVIRFVQSFLINWDDKMYYEPTKTHAKARTTTLNEELGQIQYIFSDKTGTLTQNIMTFNKCSINGRTYGDVIDLRTGEVVEVSDSELETIKNSKKSTIKNKNEHLYPGAISSQRLHKVDVHFVNSPPAAFQSSKLQEGANTTSKQVSIGSGSTTSTTRTTPLTQPTISLDNLHLRPAPPAPPTPSAPLPPLPSRSPARSPLRSPARSPSWSPAPSPSPNSPEGDVNVYSRVAASVGTTTAHYVMRPSKVQIENPLPPRIGRQASTLSNTSDKVMILGDVATNETVFFKAKSIHTTNNSNSNRQQLHHSYSHNNTFNNNYSRDLAAATAFITATATVTTTTTPASATDATHLNKIVTIKTTTVKHGSTTPTSTAVAITTLSPTSPLSLDKSGTTSVVTYLHKSSSTTNKKSKTLSFSPFTKRTPPSPPPTLQPPLLHGTSTYRQVSSSAAAKPKPCCPQFCTPFCRSCSISYDNDDDDDDEEIVDNLKTPDYLDNSPPPALLTRTTGTTSDNFLKPPESHHHHHHYNSHTFNYHHHHHTFATSTAHNWTKTHHHKHAIAPVDFSANPEYEPDFRWYDKTLLDAVRSDEEHAHNFFRLLALCHTVMPEYVDGRLEYQAQSPDESALVSAARNFGFVFRSRTPNSITIEVMGRTEEYELLHILDFNNVRKRMSVILRQGDRLVLFCKGADSVIYDRLSSSQHDMKARTQDHLNKFAGEGLRTLVLAERHLTPEFYEDWSKRHLEASISLDNREDKLGNMYEEVESEMVLVGVTAIEDKLQDGVPQTIANLQMAGIKIWVLTGDKQETAINIGYSCQLLTDDLADVFIVDGSTMEEVEKQLRQFKESIRIVNLFRPTPLDSSINLNLNGAHNNDRNTPSLKMTQVSSPPPPAISVVTFRWDDEEINKRNKGEPDSAETNELYDSLEKGGSAARNALRADEIVEENTGFAIVINGHSLVHCLSPELESRFLDIASQCKAVICCRVTPLQKALVVELIKRAKNAVTLAIGDGANDVSMIKAAHIGVGISGQEGLQAVLASDYSIAQFRYLERLLLVHGRWSYYRMCKFLRYFFYKNFAFTLCHCWYSFFCGFSAQTVFDPMFISVYNLFYTSLPVLALGVFEQDVSDKHSLEYPKLYTPGLRSQLFNTKEFVYSVLHGAFSSLILFLIPYGTYHKGVSPNGLILSDHMTLGAVVASILIIDNTAQISLYTSYWTIANHITIWGSLIWYFVLDYFYNYVIGGPYVGSLSMAMKDLTFWTTMFITVVLIMIPVLAYKFYLIDVHPSLADKIRMKRRQASLKLRHTSSVMRAPSSRRSRRSLRSGYAFAHQEGFGRLITSGKIMRKLPQEFAFPLGLGSKKVQSSGVIHDSKTNNNNSLRDNNKNSSMDVADDTSTTLNDALTNQDPLQQSNEGLSPRAPCQDLDTINL